MGKEFQTNCRVLIVEDHSDTAEVTSLILGKVGFDVTVADGYRSALDVMRAAQFDVVICDLGLSDGDGCALLIEVKAMYDVRAIALTGHGYPIDRQRCQAAGFDAFLLKPVSLDELTTTLWSIVSTLPCHEGAAENFSSAIPNS